MTIEYRPEHNNGHDIVYNPAVVIADKDTDDPEFDATCFQGREGNVSTTPLITLKTTREVMMTLW